MIESLSCGIVVYDEVSEIKNLIPKIKLELKDYNVQWVFVLNHEQEEIRRWISNWLKEQIPNCNCYENPSNNLGFARQLILDKSQNKFVYFTDPDIDLISGNIKKLLQIANAEILDSAHLNFAGFGGTVTHKSENIFLQNTFNFMSGLSKFIPFSFQIQNHSHLVSVDHLPACHLLLDREIALKIGGFSAGFSKCGEDLDFTHRAYNAGYRFVFLPSAQVLHWQNLSLSKWLYKMFYLGRIQIPVQRIHFKSGLRFYRILPLASLLFFIFLSFLHSYFIVFSGLFLLVASFVNIGILGFTLTILVYSFGELFESIVPLFAYKNAEQLKEITSNLQNQFYETKTDN